MDEEGDEEGMVDEDAWKLKLGLPAGVVDMVADVGRGAEGGVELDEDEEEDE